MAIHSLPLPLDPSTLGALREHQSYSAACFCCFGRFLAAGRRSYCVDSQRSTRVLVSSAGSVTDIYLYTLFGVEMLSGSGTVNPFRFGGQVGYFRDFANEMDIWWRRLSTLNGKWNSQDRIGLRAGDTNFTRFVGNNPVVRVDPSGLLPPQCHNSGQCCCRLVGKPSLQAIPRYIPGIRIGWDFTARISTINDLSRTELGPCKLKWKEKTNHSANPWYVPTDEWYNAADYPKVFIPRPWDDFIRAQSKECPGPVTSFDFTDSSGLNLGTASGKGIFRWMLCIRVEIFESCTGKTVSISAAGALKIELDPWHIYYMVPGLTGDDEPAEVKKQLATYCEAGK